ncbi:MAG: glycosyltransferase [Patescibacteria group bacterium]|mgnify:CR=1 FL=1|jgi:glycosyltransferase involved in cell wall biosynthesis|nr:glycosyltransferase [bacterium]HQC49619.1 glycosyltransferase [bacterium]
MADKIKVMHIIPNLRGGGAERVCFDLLMNLDADKYEKSLILFKDNGEGQIWREQLANRGVKIIALKKQYLFDLKNFREIFSAIKKNKPHILHTHLGGDIYGRLAGFLNKVPIIISTEHNLNKQERKGATCLKTLTSLWADMIFPVSEAVKQDAQKRYRLNPHKLTVIYNGIDTNIFKSKSVESLNKDEPRLNDVNLNKDKAEKIIIGSLGRLTEQKGFKILIEAISKTKHKNFLVKIGGEGELKEVLQKQIDNLGLSERIFLLGQVDPIDFLKEIDIFVLPSLWEGLGLVVLEAALANKPIIASRVDGLLEIINSDNAWLFTAGDSNELARQIDELIDNLNSEETQRKIASIRKIVEEKFSLTKMVENYSAWYEKLSQKKIKAK